MFEASWCMGDNLERSQGYEGYYMSHIAGAVFFNIDKSRRHARRARYRTCCRRCRGFSHMWTVDVGIQPDQPIVVYDRHKTLMSAPRAWWVATLFWL